MSDLDICKIYAVCIPSSLSNIVDKLPNGIASFNRLEDLTLHLSREDIFNFVFEQTNNVEFLEFITKYNLKSPLTNPENISWMNEVKEDYDIYIRKNQDSAKVNKDKLKLIRLPHNAFDILGKCNKGTELTIYLSPLSTPEHSEEIYEGKIDRVKFKRTLCNYIYDAVGFENICKHPISEYIFKTGDFC